MHASKIKSQPTRATTFRSSLIRIARKSGTASSLQAPLSALQGRGRPPLQPSPLGEDSSLRPPSQRPPAAAPFASPRKGAVPSPSSPSLTASRSSCPAPVQAQATAPAPAQCLGTHDN